MSLLDAKVIQTQLEKEIFIDEPTYFGFLNFQFHDNPIPKIEFLVKLNLGRVREYKFYGIEDVYFGISVVQNEPTIQVFSTEQRSLFAAKNEQEKDAAAELIQYLFTKSSKFKPVLMQFLDEQNTLLGNPASELVEKLRNIKLNDLKFKIREGKVV